MNFSWREIVICGALALITLVGCREAIAADAASASTASPPAKGNPAHVTTSYGYALYGALKYPAGYTHFEYANPDAPKGGVVHTTGLGSYDSFNTFALRGSSAISLASYAMYYDALMKSAWDANSQQYCLLCETISYPDDFSWVEFTLRKNARWHDGKPITPQDVLFSFDMLKNHASPSWANPLAHIVRAEQTGASSVRFYADAANNRRLPLSFNLMMIIPQHYWQGKDFTSPVTQPPLSSGPYEISSFDFGRSYTLSRVKNYWGKDLPVNRGQFNYDKIIVNYFRDTVADFEAFKAGYSDVRMESNPCKWTSGYEWPAVKDKQVVRSHINWRDAPIYEGFFFNMRLPEFQDRSLREALNYAFDFTWVNQNLKCGLFASMDTLFGNTELAAKGLPTPEELALLEPYRNKVPARVFTATYNQPLTDGTQEGLRNNLRIAAQVLQKAGYVVKGGALISPRTNKPITFEILLYDATLVHAASNLSDNLKLLGINSTIKTVDYPSYIKRTKTFDFQAIVGVIPFQPAPGEELRNIFSSKAANTPGSLNWAGIKDPVVDALIEKMIAAKTRADLLTAAHALDRVIMWNFYTAPMYQAKGYYNVAYWNRFGRPEKQPNFGFTYLSTWWIEPKKDAALQAARGTTN